MCTNYIKKVSSIVAAKTCAFPPVSQGWTYGKSFFNFFFLVGYLNLMEVSS